MVTAEKYLMSHDFVACVCAQCHGRTSKKIAKRFLPIKLKVKVHQGYYWLKVPRELARAL